MLVLRLITRNFICIKQNTMAVINNFNTLYCLQFVLVVILLLRPTKASTSTNKLALKGKHLIILPTQLRNYMDTKVNSSGHVIEANGSVPEMLDWLSHRLQFDFVPSVTSLPSDDTPSRRGKLSYLKNNEADMVVGAIVVTHQRYQQADFPMPWLWISFGAVVVSPQTTTSLGALLQPLQTEVWIGLLTAIPIFILFLGILSKLSSRQHSVVNHLDSIIKYVFGVILSQGGYLRNSLLIIRLAAAGWCLACFVLIQSYSCTLTSFLSVPQFTKPIINSIYDIPKVKNLLVVTDRGLASDNLLSNAAL